MMIKVNTDRVIIMCNTSFKHLPLSKRLTSLISGLNVVSKALKIQRVSTKNDKRKLVISSNWLDLFHFPEGAKVTETVLGLGQGLTVKREQDGDKKVYGRDYHNRAYRETMIDIRHQSKISDAFLDATNAHIIFEVGCITIKPIFNFECSPVTNPSLELHVALELENGLYSGIIKAINVIKAGSYAKIEVISDEAFQESDEFVLMSLQLRRLGYKLSCLDAKTVIALHPHYDGHTELSVIDIDDIEYIGNRVSAKAFDFNNPLSTFLALSSGVDGVSLENSGFDINSLLEWLPPEARDFKRNRMGDIVHTDKTESGAICGAINIKGLKNVFNENIFDFSLARVSKYLPKLAFSFLHISLECSDFSNAKSAKDKKAHIQSLDSSRDMIFPLIDLLNSFEHPPMSLLIENVTNFFRSTELALLNFELTRMGYNVHSSILKASDLNAYTNRQRCYVYSTALETDGESFTFPESIERTKNAWHDIIEPNLSELRDVTHTKSLQLAISGGRLRPVNYGDAVVPTIMRSQNRQVKDSVYVRIGDRYYMPSVEMLKQLMSIEPNFNTDHFSIESATQFIGQSVDVGMHQPLLVLIKDHILSFVKKALESRSYSTTKRSVGYPPAPAYV
ncbi:DNA cytosine methyltransferase (plasmid) [Shewanella xiamenensis]|uniref:DNA (cytosine-5-)-methyltransferase n=1 Tax=Shewanella xiamenensis TaxID=332186 RepID=A0ABT6UEW7_9GAMM|nr:DNA cytosine methyltransferase [Shewanella xiamenensis]MDI5832482.1 DNA cytosine methyltransferase [Shewanella xiamenensis]WHF57899.1 DNA cytosine methyltransferase [Shewanella xiamenensis]